MQEFYELYLTFYIIVMINTNVVIDYRPCVLVLFICDQTSTSQVHSVQPSTISLRGTVLYRASCYSVSSFSDFILARQGTLVHEV